MCHPIEVSVVARLPELAVARGVQEGTVWTVEMSAKSWGVAEWPVDSKGGWAVRILGLLGARLPTHHLWRKRGVWGVRKMAEP